RSCGRRAGWDGRRRRDGAVDAWNWRDRHTWRSRYGTSSSVVLRAFWRATGGVSLGSDPWFVSSHPRRYEASAVPVIRAASRERPLSRRSTGAVATDRVRRRL